jgi:mannose-6-phosphate isomerase-like protein (cupin superfamily)
MPGIRTPMIDAREPDAMKYFDIRATRETFKVLHSTADAQAAIMTLRPGQDTGEVQNEHPKAEQWLYVISGSGQAIVGGKRRAVKDRSLMLIPKGAAHQIKNTSRRQLLHRAETTGVPPAYTRSGEVRPHVKRRRD